MKITVDVPEVGNCSARQCAFNCDGTCHAQAITIGDAVEPICDTYLAAGHHSCRAASGGVGACKVSRCRHNQDLSCQAESVRVTVQAGQPECGTFSPR